MTELNWFGDNTDESGDDFADDFDDALDDEYDDDDEAELVPCPNCGQPVYEDAPQCPYCGEYIVAATNPWGGRPWWWMLLGIAGLVGLLWALVAGF